MTMRTLLVVDDDAVDRELVTRCLRTIEDLEITYARDGNEALEAIGAHAPDLILTDLRMPGMDGLDLVRRLRDDQPLLPVLLMTSHGSERLAVDALQAGAASYVPKRDLKHHLAELVEQVLDLIEARQSRYEVLRYLGRSDSHFELVNDPALISPLVGFLEDNLERLGFATATVRTQVGMALIEAISNAMIHGNLEISSEVRDAGLEEYYGMIRERSAAEPHASRRVRVSSSESTDRVRYVIEDEGPGFDPASLPDPFRARPHVPRPRPGHFPDPHLHGRRGLQRARQPPHLDEALQRLTPVRPDRTTVTPSPLPDRPFARKHRDPRLRPSAETSCARTHRCPGPRRGRPSASTTRGRRALTPRSTRRAHRGNPGEVMKNALLPFHAMKKEGGGTVVSLFVPPP